MERPPFLRVAFGGRSPSWSHYRIARQLVAIDRSYPDLEAFQVSAFPSGTELPGRDLLQPQSLQRTFEGEVWLGGRRRQVSCWFREGDFLLVVDGVGEFSLLKEGVVLHRDGTGPLEIEDSALLELLAGPMLLLPLAGKGIFGLHASAVRIDGGLVAFAGESGVGKSTLAAAGARAGVWQRRADDLLPWTLSSLGPIGLLEYPQLKVPELGAVARKEPELPLEAIYFLASNPESSAGEVTISPLGAKQGALALTRHTASSRLFDGGRLERLLETAAVAGESLPMRRLIVPRKLSYLPKVWEAVLGDLQ